MSDLHSPNPAAALDAQGCRDVLRAHGYDGDLRVTELGGGVSNVVYAVDGGAAPLVVKQALARLRVADEWRAPRQRLLTEGRALQFAAQLTPDAVPEVAFLDTARYVLAMRRAPGDWTDWKTALLAGVIDTGVGERLGGILASWHARTADPECMPGWLSDLEAFELLRVDPYYRTTAARLPELAHQIDGYIRSLGQRRICLVHGDFSPKNVLVAPDASRVWIIDFEVAHRGDPAFDLAFMLTHLCLKAIHRPGDAQRYDQCASGFVSAYLDGVSGPLRPDLGYVLGHVGCMLLARVHGKSPAEYLDAAGRAHASALGRGVLADPPTTLAGLTALRRARIPS